MNRRDGGTEAAAPAHREPEIPEGWPRKLPFRKRPKPYSRAVPWAPTPERPALQINPTVRDRSSPYELFVAQSVLHEVRQHLITASTDEPFGFLLGQVVYCPWTETPYVLVDAVRRETQNLPSSDEVDRFRHAWIGATRDARHRREQLIGWYHRHGVLGLRMSEWDLKLQDEFFPEPWQVALIVAASAQGPIGGFIQRSHRARLFRKGLAPFHELVDLDAKPVEGLKASVVDWTNYQSGHPVHVIEAKWPDPRTNLQRWSEASHATDGVVPLKRPQGEVEVLEFPTTNPDVPPEDQLAPPGEQHDGHAAQLEAREHDAAKAEADEEAAARKEAVASDAEEAATKPAEAAALKTAEDAAARAVEEAATTAAEEADARAAETAATKAAHEAAIRAVEAAGVKAAEAAAAKAVAEVTARFAEETAARQAEETATKETALKAAEEETAARDAAEAAAKAEKEAALEAERAAAQKATEEAREERAARSAEKKAKRTAAKRAARQAKEAKAQKAAEAAAAMAAEEAAAQTRPTAEPRIEPTRIEEPAAPSRQLYEDGIPVVLVQDDRWRPTKNTLRAAAGVVILLGAGMGIRALTAGAPSIDPLPIPTARPPTVFQQPPEEFTRLEGEFRSSVQDYRARYVAFRQNRAACESLAADFDAVVRSHALLAGYAATRPETRTRFAALDASYKDAIARFISTSCDVLPPPAVVPADVGVDGLVVPTDGAVLPDSMPAPDAPDTTADPPPPGVS